MRLGEAYQLVLREVQHEVWKRRSRGETASTISHHLGIDVDTVHAWFLEWSAKQDAAYQLTRPTGTLTVVFGASSSDVDDHSLNWRQQR